MSMTTILSLRDTPPTPTPPPPSQGQGPLTLEQKALKLQQRPSVRNQKIGTITVYLLACKTHISRCKNGQCYRTTVKLKCTTAAFFSAV